MYMWLRCEICDRISTGSSTCEEGKNSTAHTTETWRLQPMPERAGYTTAPAAGVRACTPCAASTPVRRWGLVRYCTYQPFDMMRSPHTLTSTSTSVVTCVLAHDGGDGVKFRTAAGGARFGVVWSATSECDPMNRGAALECAQHE